MKILVVEDNRLNLELVSEILEMRGIEVLQAETGEEAITVAQQGQPALILMDVSLPGMDGLEATRQLKKDGATSAIPVIAVTAHNMPSDRESALEAGCIGHISKPINIATFVDEVLRFLS